MTKPNSPPVQAASAVDADRRCHPCRMGAPKFFCECNDIFEDREICADCLKDTCDCECEDTPDGG